MAETNYVLGGSPLSLTYGAADDGGVDGDSSTDGNSGSLSMGKAWALLVVAILLEVAGTTAMKLSDGFRNILPSIMIYVLYALSFTVLPFSLQAIELSTAYAVWSGLGTTVTAIVGFVWFNDTVNGTKIFALAAIIGGCVVLKFADANEVAEEGQAAGGGDSKR